MIKIVDSFPYHPSGKQERLKKVKFSQRFGTFVPVLTIPMYTFFFLFFFKGKISFNYSVILMKVIVPPHGVLFSLNISRINRHCHTLAMSSLSNLFEVSLMYFLVS